MSVNIRPLSELEAAALRARYDAYHQWHDSLLHAPTGRVAYALRQRSAEMEALSLTNEQTSALEVYEFIHKPPTHVVAYVSARTVTNWTGRLLGRIVRVGRVYQNNFGARIEPLIVIGINGLIYHGNAYLSAGTYCRLSAYQDQSAARRKVQF